VNLGSGAICGSSRVSRLPYPNVAAAVGLSAMHLTLGAPPTTGTLCLESYRAS
jgi:hypothetical protein